MKNRILLILGVLFIIVLPLYQAIESGISNVSGDGDTVYGDNIIFREVLGVKTVNQAWGINEWDGRDGWETISKTLKTPKWMQALGLPKKVTKHSGFDQTDSHYWTIWVLRAFVKFILFSIGLLFLYTALKTER